MYYLTHLGSEIEMSADQTSNLIYADLAQARHALMTYGRDGPWAWAHAHVA